MLAKKAGEEITLFPFYLLPFFLAAVGGARLRNLGACITRKNEANVGRYSARFMSQAGVFVVKSPQPFSPPTKSTGNPSLPSSLVTVASGLNRTWLIKLVNALAE